MILSKETGECRRERIKKTLTYSLVDNQYFIGDLLAEGSYGLVFYAEDKSGRPLAIKTLDLSILEGLNEQERATMARRIDQEDEAMRACNNQYVMKCFDTILLPEQGLKLIVMQYCNGCLQDLIYFRGHIPEIQAKMILKQILFGLAQFHRNGRIHRDIKTANVCQKLDRFILCDFGSSRVLNNNEHFDWRKTFRIDGTSVGTAISKSPEMLAGQSYGVRTDIWGIGILYYEMLTGSPPFYFGRVKSSLEYLPFIKKNIDKIYDPEYIKRNLQTRNLELKGNTTLSQQAIQFLKKLIVFDHSSQIDSMETGPSTRRAGWNELLKDKYLLSSKKIKKTKRCSYLLPLKDIDWTLVEKHLEVIKGNNYEINDRQFEVNIRSVTKIRKLTKKQVEQLCCNLNELYKNENLILKDLKKIHFKMQRLELLLKVRGELSEMKEKTNKVGLLIMKFCLLEIKSIGYFVEKSTPVLQFIKNYQSDSLMERVKQIYQLDFKDFSEDQSGITGIFKQLLRSVDQQKRKTYLFLQSVDVEPKMEILNLICSYLEVEVKKLNEKLEKEEVKLSRDMRAFLQNPIRILKAEYEPTIKEDWQQWHTFEQILDYLKFQDLLYIMNNSKCKKHEDLLLSLDHLKKAHTKYNWGTEQDYIYYQGKINDFYHKNYEIILTLIKKPDQ